MTCTVTELVDRCQRSGRAEEATVLGADQAFLSSPKRSSSWTHLESGTPVLVPAWVSPASHARKVGAGLLGPLLQQRTWCTSAAAYWDPILSAGIFCNGTFDQYVCWPHSSPGNISVPCPSYLPWWREGNELYFTIF